MKWRRTGKDGWRLFDHEGEWVGYVDPTNVRKAAVWDNGWRTVPLPPDWSIEDAKATVLAVAALEA